MKWNHKHTIILVFGLILIAGFILCLGMGRYYVPAVRTVRILADYLTPVPLEVTWTDMMESAVCSDPLAD